MTKNKKPTKGVICINRKGTLYWYVRKGDQRVYCGKGEEGRKIAEAARAKWIAQKYENKEIGAGLKVKRTEFKAFTDLANWYMTLPGVQEKKVYKRKVDCAAHLIEFFGNKPINQIEGDEQERFREFRKTQGAADGTIDLEIELLSAIFHLAVKRKKIPPDAMPGEFIQKNNRNPRRIISEEEFEKLLECSDPDFQDFLLCGYETAMRLSEVLTLTAGQVFLNVKHISGETVSYIDLGIFDTKTRTRRTIPVSERLKKVLQRRLEGLKPDVLIFTGISRGLVNYKMSKACKMAAIPYGDRILNEKGEKIGVVFHCLRSTRTTRWVEMGFSDEIIRRATGHESLKAYRHYVRISDVRSLMRLVEGPQEKRHKNDITAEKNLEKEDEKKVGEM